MHKLILVCFVVLLASCTHISRNTKPLSSLKVESYAIDQVIFPIDCSIVVCTEGFANEGYIWMTDLSDDVLRSGDITNGQIVQLQLLWLPEAGKTPLAETSTNFVIEHIIVSDGEVGIYGGGGFCWPHGNATTGLTLDVEDATIAMQEQSDGFNDLLTPATVTGLVRSNPDANKSRLIEAAALRIKNQ